MRAIHTATKSLSALAVIAALMTIPSIASASPMYWAEHDADPIDTVTVDLTGTVDVDVSWGATVTASCEVTGEVELTNNWNNPTSPATQTIVSLQPADSVANSCSGSVNGSGWCGLTDLSYDDTPWTGTTDSSYISTLDDIAMSMTWCYPNYHVEVSGQLDTVAIIDAVGEQYCGGITGFEFDDVVYDGGSYPGPATVSGHLDFDLETLDGLEDQEQGPCVTLQDYVE